MTSGVTIYLGNGPMTFVDTGCDLHPKCLSCPLPACKHDRPEEGGNGSWIHDAKVERRRQEVVRLLRQGVARTEVMRRFGITERTTYRMTERERKP